MLFLFLRSTFSTGYGILGIHVLRGSVQHVRHGLQIILVNKEQKNSESESISKGHDQDLIISFVDQ